MKKDNERRFSVRFNLDKPQHNEAWNNLQQIAKGDRNEHCIFCLLENGINSPMEIAIKNMIHVEFKNLREELQRSNRNNPLNSSVQYTNQVEQGEKEVDQGVMDFLDSL